MTGYSKLFGSILDSTIWQAPDHVRLLWVTMLAMKDADGIVEAAIPGLAKRANLSLEATEDALKILMSPDPYSRTKDHDGRRIDTVDGGWLVLNHDKYRRKLDQDERRARTAARVARHRAKNATSKQDSTVTPDVTRGNAGNAALRKVRHADTEADTGSGGGGPDRRSSPSPSGDPDRGAGRDHHQPPLSPAAVADPANRRTLVHAFVERVNSLRARLSAELGITPHLRPIALMGGQSETDLLDRLRASADPAGDLDHVLAVVEGEVRDGADPRWLGWSLGTEGSWRAKLAAPLAPRRQAAKPVGRVEPGTGPHDTRAPWEISHDEVERARGGRR